MITAIIQTSVFPPRLALARNDVRIERFYGHGLRAMSECEFLALLFYHIEKALASYFAWFLRIF